MIDTSNLNFPIDAVITWVDGNDKKWQKKINDHSEVDIDWNSKKEMIRYNSIDEIDIAIRSIIKNATFIRNIFLVTDDQIPSSFNNLKEIALKANINLSLVDHKVIFRDFEHCLPNFNSCSIISMLYRIPDISEYFLIFNDDTFLMKPTKADDFFMDGKPVIRGRWSKFYEDRLLRKVYHKIFSFFGKHENKMFPGYKRAQQKSAKLLGFKKFLRRDHTPVSIRKSTLEKYFSTKRSLDDNVKYRFRSEKQFIISALSTHLEIRNNTYFLKRNFQLTYFQSYKNLFLIWLKLLLFSKSNTKLFMCFQNLEMADTKKLNYILNWIENRLK